ncbi:VTS1 [Candida margitis]|uniref:VTS1 n=1 Tax=Candida margitis TaxID=1775924 RepID=UPI0022260D2D|nr:VTS1 [Candida margitis]KAI5949665.1 VTS1 [Candida margitis]
MDPSESKHTSSVSLPHAPIVLSPPPLDRAQPNSQQQIQLNQSEFLPQNYQGNRQQSVGYNLQHEFETLTAELDLDLKNQGRMSQSVPPPISLTQGQNQFQVPQQHSATSSNLIAPAASKYNDASISSNLLNLGSANSASNSESQKETNSLSPAPQVAPSNPQLVSLLENRVQSSQPTGGLLQPPSASIPDRPQSAHDFTNIFRRTGHALTGFGNQGAVSQQLQQQSMHQSNLYSDLLVFSNWIENLSPQDTVSMIDYLCASLPVDVLLTFQAKLDQHLQAYNQPPGVLQQNPLSPYGNTALNSDLYNDMDNLSLNEQKSKFKPPPSAQKSADFQPTTETNSFNPSLLNIDKGIARPRSADPFLQKNQQNANLGNPLSLERSKSPTSHLHEKTNFLQLAANNSQNVSPYYYQYGNSNQAYYSPNQQINSAAPGLHQDENLDMSSTALKLGALATINSRVALDSNRKHPHGSSSWNTGPQSQQNQHGSHHIQHYQQHNQAHHQASPQNSDKFNHNLSISQAMNFENSINRGANSASVPASSHVQRNNFNIPSGLKKRVASPSASNMQQSNVSTSSINSQTGANASSSSSMPSEVASVELLNNIPAWLKLLRLHKYTDCLKDMYWKDLIELNSDQLEEKGVAALGARRKLLKAFEAVKNSQ